MLSGRNAFAPRTQALCAREAWVSKCATCSRACTPRSVLPAAVTETACAAILASAASTASCTALPPGWVCQPRKRLPSYSSPMARRGISAQFGEELLRLPLLLAVAVLHDFVEKIARAVLVAHLLVRFREIELGGHFLPLWVGSALRREHAVLARAAEVEVDG